MTKNLYGIDLSKPINGTMARDAMIKCFCSAHKELVESELDVPENEKQKYSEASIKAMIKLEFKKLGSDFNNPSKADLQMVCDSLAKIASQFRNKEVVNKHYAEIELILGKVKE